MKLRIRNSALALFDAMAAIAIGILALQILTVIPVLGGLFLLVSGQIGAGALLYTIWSKGRRPERAASLLVQPA